MKSNIFVTMICIGKSIPLMRKIPSPFLVTSYLFCNCPRSFFWFLFADQCNCDYINYPKCFQSFICSVWLYYISRTLACQGKIEYVFCKSFILIIEQVNPSAFPQNFCWIPCRYLCHFLLNFTAIISPPNYDPNGDAHVHTTGIAAQ